MLYGMSVKNKTLTLQILSKGTNVMNTNIKNTIQNFSISFNLINYKINKQTKQTTDVPKEQYTHQRFILLWKNLYKISFKKAMAKLNMAKLNKVSFNIVPLFYML